MVLLTLPLSPSGGLAGGMLSLAVGQYLAVTRIAPQSRWRFRASNAYSHGVARMLLAILGSAAVMQIERDLLASMRNRLWVLTLVVRTPLAGLNRIGETGGKPGASVGGNRGRP